MIGIYAWLAGVHWGRVGTWALAICTLSLAFFTWRVSRAAIKTIEQNNKIIESEERHHQERMSPIVALDFYTEWNHLNINDLINLSRIEDQKIYLNGSISNKGYGPSNNGSLYLLCRTLNAKPQCVKIDLPILAPGQVWSNSKIKGMECIEINIIDRSLEKVITNAVKSKEWQVVLSVEDIFKKKHFTQINPNQKDNCVYVSFDRLSDVFYQELRNGLRH